MQARALATGGEMSYFLTSRIVDSVLAIWQRIPGPVIHNLDKARMLKRIFWHLNVDGVPGDYIEFGVAHGHSLRAAEIAEKKSSSKAMGVNQMKRQLFGFDTFERFISDSSFDAHPTWDGTAFNVDYERVSKRFRRRDNVYLIQVDANTLYSEESTTPAANFGIRKMAAVVLFDMDLYAPTIAALFWSRQLLQQGTFLIFDEFFSFSGDSSKGESRALREFLVKFPEITLRDFASYGCGGRVFVVDFSKST